MVESCRREKGNGLVRYIEIQRRQVAGYSSEYELNIYCGVIATDNQNFSRPTPLTCFCSFEKLPYFDSICATTRDTSTFDTI